MSMGHLGNSWSGLGLVEEACLGGSHLPPGATTLAQAYSSLSFGRSKESNWKYTRPLNDYTQDWYFVTSASIYGPRKATWLNSHLRSGNIFSCLSVGETAKSEKEVCGYSEE